MTLTLSTNGETIRDTFRTWNAERDALETELGESLTALAAYQSHLDDWQQQLAREREDLQSAIEQFNSRRSEVGATYSEIDREREELRAAQVELDRGQRQLHAAREHAERDRSELQAARDQIAFDRNAVAGARTEVEKGQQELQSAQTQLERNRAELEAVRSQFELGQNEARSALEQIQRERAELRAAQLQFEQERAAADQVRSEASSASIAELNAAREKISALTTSLLSRTEELRTLDNRRAEIVTELELARARENELKAALDEHKGTAEQERSHWKEELRHLRELLEKRVDGNATEGRVVPATQQPVVDVPSQPASASSHPTARENPVLGSIVEQFDKLRQQRANDRQSATKTR